MVRQWYIEAGKISEKWGKVGFCVIALYQMKNPKALQRWGLTGVSSVFDCC
jgi:hypothetical protein